MTPLSTKVSHGSVSATTKLTARFLRIGRRGTRCLRRSHCKIFMCTVSVRIISCLILLIREVTWQSKWCVGLIPVLNTSNSPISRLLYQMLRSKWLCRRILTSYKGGPLRNWKYRLTWIRCKIAIKSRWVRLVRWWTMPKSTKKHSFFSQTKQPLTKKYWPITELYENGRSSLKKR